MGELSHDAQLLLLLIHIHTDIEVEQDYGEIVNIFAKNVVY